MKLITDVNLIDWIEEEDSSNPVKKKSMLCVIYSAPYMTL